MYTFWTGRKCYGIVEICPLYLGHFSLIPYHFLPIRITIWFQLCRLSHDSMTAFRGGSSYCMKPVKSRCYTWMCWQLCDLYFYRGMCSPHCQWIEVRFISYVLDLYWGILLLLVPRVSFTLLHTTFTLGDKGVFKSKCSARLAPFSCICSLAFSYKAHVYLISYICWLVVKIRSLTSSCQMSEPCGVLFCFVCHLLHTFSGRYSNYECLQRSAQWNHKLLPRNEIDREPSGVGWWIVS